MPNKIFLQYVFPFLFLSLICSVQKQTKKWKQITQQTLGESDCVVDILPIVYCYPEEWFSVHLISHKALGILFFKITNSLYSPSICDTVRVRMRGRNFQLNSSSPSPLTMKIAFYIVLANAFWGFHDNLWETVQWTNRLIDLTLGQCSLLVWSIISHYFRS